MKNLIITEEEKKHILSLHQNLNIKGILQEELEGNVYTTENDQRIYFGTNTSFDYIDIKKGTKFTRTQGGATAFGGGLVFSCSRVGTVNFENGSGNKHFTYKKKTYWASALQKRLISVFCGSIYSDKKSCKGNCENGYGKLTTTDGAVVTGNFKDGKVNGYATSIWNSGDKYQGNFKDGDFNGYGNYTSKEGDKYQGNWKDGKYNGKGKYISSDGSIWWGEFNMGEVTDQTYYKNIKGCFFKGKGGRTADGYWSLNGKDSDFRMDEMECTPGKWIDLANPQTPVGSNAGNPPAGEVGNPSSGSDGNPPAGVGSSVVGCTKYNDCSSKDGSTTKFVKCDTCSEISRLQACLKDANGNMLKTDSKWGKNTEAALNLINYNGTDGITSEIITSICSNFNQVPDVVQEPTDLA